MSLWEDHYGIEVGQNKGGINSRKSKTENEALPSARPPVRTSLPAPARVTDRGDSVILGFQRVGVGQFPFKFKFPLYVYFLLLIYILPRIKVDDLRLLDAGSLPGRAPVRPPGGAGPTPPQARTHARTRTCMNKPTG